MAGLLSRATLITLALRRCEEANCLLEAGYYSGAYYMGGYSAELGLKACIAGQFVSREIPNWASTGKFKTHDLVLLLEHAALQSTLPEAVERNWEIVKKWKTDSRYIDNVEEQTVREFIAALTDLEGGVLTWIKTRW